MHERLVFLKTRYHFALQLSFTLVFWTTVHFLFLFLLLLDVLRPVHYNFPIIIFTVCPISWEHLKFNHSQIFKQLTLDLVSSIDFPIFIFIVLNLQFESLTFRPISFEKCWVRYLKVDELVPNLILIFFNLSKMTDWQMDLNFIYQDWMILVHLRWVWHLTFWKVYIIVLSIVHENWIWSRFAVD